jgi:hypothetical protein
MPRRHLVPLVLVAALAVFALLFAFIGASAAPDSATLIVQNATAQTFGSPTGTTTFSLSLVDSIAVAANTANISQTRLITYRPYRMAVYQVGSSSSKLIALLGTRGSHCALTSYTAIIGGTTPWKPSGYDTYTRTESLADYSSRVPYASNSSCVSRPSTVRGTVGESATVKSGYLTNLRLLVVVPPQRNANGTQAAHGVEGESLNLLKINGTRPSPLGP